MAGVRKPMLLLFFLHKYISPQPPSEIWHIYFPGRWAFKCLATGGKKQPKFPSRCPFIQLGVWFLSLSNENWKTHVEHVKYLLWPPFLSSTTAQHLSISTNRRKVKEHMFRRLRKTINNSPDES